MKNVLRIFASHPTAANLLMLIFIFAGLITAPDIRRETFPDYASTEVEIRVVYPGASAEEVEEGVCRRIEDALESVTDLYEIRSEAREGLGVVTAEMEEGGDIGRFIIDVKTEVDAIDDFPEETETAVVRELSRTDAVVSMAVSGPMSLPDLKLFAEEIKQELQVLPGVSQVAIQGFSEHQIRIELPADVLMELGLSVSEVAQRVATQSVNLPAGVIETDDADLLIRFMDERRNAREFEDLVISSSSTGAEVRLGDVANITDLFELDEENIQFNGERAAILRIEKTKREDALRIMDEVEKYVERKRAEMPSTVQFTLTQNVSKIVRDRLDMLLINGVEGLILVFLAMWLFFSFRYSFWVSMGLPVSFLGAICAMNVIGYSLNMLTMVGLLLATGLIMDDAIVIAENIASHIKKGKKVLDAAVDGVAEVAMGVLSSFLTTVFIFGSIAVLIEGDIGKVLRVMPVVLIVTLGVSLIEAFFILPNHLVHSLSHSKSSQSDDTAAKRFRAAFEARFEMVREKVLGRAVDWTVTHRYLFLGLVISVFLISLSMLAGGVLKVRAFPEIDGDVLQARVLLPQGTPLSRTEDVAKHLTDVLDDINHELSPLQPEGADLIQEVSVMYNTNADSHESGAHLVTISADLLDAEKRNTSIDELTNMWRDRVGAVPDVINIAYKEPTLGPGGLAIEIRLQGHDLVKLKQASLDLRNWLERYDGVLDLDDDLRPGKREIRLRLRAGAMALGVNAGMVADQLRSAFHGKTAAEIQVGPESYEIDVRLRPEDQDSIADLELFHVTLPDGSQTPLGEVAILNEGRGWARIARIQRLRTVSVTGDVDTKKNNAAAIIADTAKNFLPEFLAAHPGVTCSLEGQAKESNKTGASLRKALMVGLFGIFVILSLQFKSYVEPFVIITAIPMAAVGVIWGHLIMGLELSMPSIMGFVSLAGVVVNDSILLVQFIKMNRDKNMDTAAAACMASRRRFRPILLTSLTTIAGLLPLLLERSLQAQVLIPLATSLVFGLMASSVLVLLVIPAFYVVLEDFRRT